jgi:hypothetical protein
MKFRSIRPDRMSYVSFGSICFVAYSVLVADLVSSLLLVPY